MASAQKARDAVDNAIKASDEIRPGNYINVAVEKTGLFGKPFLVLTGRCTSDKDKAKVEEVATAAAGEIKVESRLRVSQFG